MGLQVNETAGFGVQDSTRQHQDIEFEIGALASRHGLNVDVARSIIAECDHDLDCIDERAKAWKARN